MRAWEKGEGKAQGERGRKGGEKGEGGGDRRNEWEKGESRKMEM